MNYPANCNKCTQVLYGPVKYCPFCGTASASVTATSEKQKLETIRSAISSSLSQGEYSPNIRGSIRQKGKEIGITEEASDSLLLTVLREKGFSPVEDGVNDPLAVSWYSAEKMKLKEKTTQQQPLFTPENTPHEQERVRVRQEVRTEKQTLTPAPYVVINKKDDVKPPSKNRMMLTAVVVGIILIIGAFSIVVFTNFYYNNIDKPKKTDQFQEEQTQKEKRLREEARKAESEEQRAETERLKEETERLKAEARKAESEKQRAETERLKTEAAKAEKSAKDEPPVVKNLQAYIIDSKGHNVNTVKDGETIELAMKYDVVAPRYSDVQEVEVEESNYLVNSRGVKTENPELTRRKTRRINTGIEAAIQIQIPKYLPGGNYTHVSIVKLEDKETKKEQQILIAKSNGEVKIYASTKHN